MKLRCVRGLPSNWSTQGSTGGGVFACVGRRACLTCCSCKFACGDIRHASSPEADCVVGDCWPLPPSPDWCKAICWCRLKDPTSAPSCKGTLTLEEIQAFHKQLQCLPCKIEHMAQVIVRHVIRDVSVVLRVPWLVDVLMLCTCGGSTVGQRICPFHFGLVSTSPVPVTSRLVCCPPCAKWKDWKFTEVNAPHTGLMLFCASDVASPTTWGGPKCLILGE